MYGPRGHVLCGAGVTHAWHGIHGPAEAAVGSATAAFARAPASNLQCHMFCHACSCVWLPAAACFMPMGSRQLVMVMHTITAGAAEAWHGVTW
jgi:hypothetical protein